MKYSVRQRRQKIVSWLNEQGSLNIDDLTSFFDTSAVTIRKDLNALEESGLLIRKLAGAICIPKEFISESSVESVVSSQKIAIAKLAAEQILDHNRIIVDSGSTVAALIPLLSKKQGLVVMTNSMLVATQLIELENEPTLLMTGGTWDSNSESFQGKVAEQALSAYNFDQLFIGAGGIDLERGSTTFNEITGLSKKMAEVAREIIILVESDKFDRKMPNLELPWSKIDTLITDDDLDIKIKERLLALDINVLYAKSENI